MLIIALLKSKRSLAEVLNYSFDHDRIKGIKQRLNKLKGTEWIKKIFNELRETEIILKSHDELRDIKGIKKRCDKLSDIKIIKRRFHNITKTNLSKLEKEQIKQYLTKLERSLSKCEKYRNNDNDDFNYRGIREIEILFVEVDEKDYYKPILAKSAFKAHYKKISKLPCSPNKDKKIIGKRISFKNYALFKRYDKWS